MSSSTVPKPNYVTFILSSTLLYFVSGVTLFLFLFDQPLVAYLQAQIHHIVEIKKDTKDSHSIMQILQSSHQVDTLTIETLGPQKAIQFMLEETGMDFSLGDQNPFSELIIFKSQRRIDIDLRELESTLESQKEVSNTFIQHDYLKEIKKRVVRWKKYLLLTFSLLALGSFILLAGLIRLTLYSDRKIIKTKQLVGASFSYVIKPYIFRFLGLCFISMLVSGVFLYALSSYSSISLVFSNSELLVNRFVVSLAVAWLVLTGIILYWVSYKVMSFLKRPYEELG